MEQKPIRIGLAGLGRAGVNMHLAELEARPSQFCIAAGCDVIPERVADFKKRFPEAAGYADADEMFADPGLEMVALAMPSRLHVDMARRALAAGKMVFLEKPFALSEEGLRRLREADSAFPGKLFLRHNRRFEACYNHVFEIMRSGQIGEVFEIKLRRLRHRFRDDWQTRLDCGGGQLNNWGPHLIDQSLHLLESDVESIWSDMKRIAARGDAEDHIKIVFRGTNGRIVDMEISDAATTDEPVISVYGSRGSILSRDERTLRIRRLPESFVIPPDGARLETPPLFGPHVYSMHPDPKWIEEEIPVSPANGYEMSDIYSHLYRAVRGGVPFPVKNEEGFRTVETTLRIRARHPEFTSAPDLFS